MKNVHGSPFTVGGDGTVNRERSTVDGPLMLNGVTVIELGQVIAGTYGGAILAELGAEVIKVEPFTGDTVPHVLSHPADQLTGVLRLFFDQHLQLIVGDEAQVDKNLA